MLSFMTSFMMTTKWATYQSALYKSTFTLHYQYMDDADATTQVPMLERLLSHRDAIEHVLSTNSLHVDNLTSQQWSVASRLLSTLQPLVQMTHDMCDSSYALLSSVIAMVTSLRHALTTSTQGLHTLHDVLLSQLDETFADVFSDDELCAATVLGMILYCRYFRHNFVACIGYSEENIKIHVGPH